MCEKMKRCGRIESEWFTVGELFLVCQTVSFPVSCITTNIMADESPFFYVFIVVFAMVLLMCIVQFFCWLFNPRYKEHFRSTGTTNYGAAVIAASIIV